MKNLAVSVLLPLLLLAAAVVCIAQVDVPRRTTAVTYPLDQEVLLQFKGTTRFPRMRGSAKVKRTGRMGTEVELSVVRMPRPFELGAGYATYVLWAISPDGQVDNMGEIKRKGFFEFDSKLTVTTPLQTFALIVTAEPHFLVRRPSQAIMLENLNPYTANGKQVSTTSTVQYFGNSSDYFKDSRTPEIAEADYAKIPPTILQAKQAVALAKYAGAERDDPEDLREAEVLLENAENAWKAGRNAEYVDITARKSVSTSVKAEATALIRKDAREKRNEKMRSDDDARRAEEKVTDAQNQIAGLREELARETRNRELAERDALNFSNQLKELRDENGRLREEIGRMKLDAENAKARAEAAEKERQAQLAQRDKEAKVAKIKAGESELINSLKRFGTAVKIDNSIVLVLAETLWTGSRVATLAPQSDGKLTSLAEILVNNPDYEVTVESHTDNTGNADTIQSVTETRAKLIADKFITMGVAESRIRSRGFGSSVPAVPNTTVANRAKNRRVNIILNLNIQ